MGQELERRWIGREEAEVRVEGEGDDPKRVVGFGIVYDRWSQGLGGFKEIIRPGAATDALKGADIRSLFNHDPNFVLGRTTASTLEVEESDRGVRYAATSPDTQWARDLLVSINRRDITGSSFSFRVAKKGETWTEKDGTYTREITKLQLVADLGPVTFPAYTQTSAQVRSLMAASGLNFEALAGLLFRAEHGLPPLAADRELIQASITVLTGLLGADAGQGPGADGQRGDEPQGRLSFLRRRLQLIEREL